MIGPKVTRPTAAESRAARAAVRARSKGICEACGQRPATEQHHRLYRSRLGWPLDTVDNLLDLCGGEGGMFGGNHSGCHGVAHTKKGARLGWSVKSGLDPAQVPVFHRHTNSWTLRGETISAPRAIEILGALGQMDEVA